LEESTVTEEKTIDGRTKRAADLALSKRTISPDSHRALLEGRIDLAAAKELGRDAGPGGPAVRVNKNDRTPTKTPCLCGCGELVPKTFKAGHDMRTISLAKAYVRGERELTPEQLEYVETSGKLDRARAQVEKEDRRKAERATKKAGEG